MFTSAPKKSFGQHFLQHPQVISEILHAMQIKPSDRVIEIGPGRGALTRPLLRLLEQVIAIEVDLSLYQAWMQEAIPHFQLLHADALAVDYHQWGKDIRLVGNLPYNISTPFLIHLLSYLQSIQDMHFMLQKEVVDRLVAQPGTKDYGRLTVMVQAYCETDWLFDVPPEAFYPPPKVNSAVLRLTPKVNVQVERLSLEKLMQKAFAMRRKTLANNLKGHVSVQTLEALGIDPKARPEEISVSQYLALALLHHNSMLPNDLYA